jgi:signal peptidase I
MQSSLDEINEKGATSDVQEPSSEKDEALTFSENILDQVSSAPERRWMQALREVAETILLTLLIFGAINLLTGRFRIEGPSMLPNLHDGQYLIINKIVYRLHPPQRGDIIVFHHPRNSDRDLIKRVIGLPGETVEIRNGQVLVNGLLLDEPYVLQPGRYSDTFELGEKEYFVLGDNRPNSDDSHNWGALQGDQIVGKAWISYWPPSEWGGVPHVNYPEKTSARWQDGDADARATAAADNALDGVAGVFIGMTMGEKP